MHNTAHPKSLSNSIKSAKLCKIEKDVKFTQYFLNLHCINSAIVV